MGGFVNVLISVVAALSFYGTGHPFLFWISALSAVISFWCWGVMHNYAMDSAKARWDQLRSNMILEGRPSEDIARLDRTPINPSKADINAVPDPLSFISMIAFLVAAILLIWGIIVRFL